MIQTQLLTIPTAPKPELETPGLFGGLYPRIQVSLNVESGTKPKTAVTVVHPAGNFLTHYSLIPLAERGFATIGISTRFAGNDTGLFMEQVLLDQAAAVRFARQQGFENVVIIGNSGGGGVVATYQGQAEHPTITSTPAGDPPNIVEANLPPADGVIFLAAHPGRPKVLTDWLDAAVLDERDPHATDAALDMYNLENGPPYSGEFIARYRQAQLDRNNRISAWCWAKLAELKARGDGSRDFVFTVHRTNADLCFMDLNIDPSERAQGSYRGDARVANINGMGLMRASTLRSWLSQWSVSASNGDGYTHAAHISKPTFIVSCGADQGVFPRYARGYFDAIPHDNKELVTIPKAPHFMDEQPERMLHAMDVVADWLKRKGF